MRALQLSAGLVLLFALSSTAWAADDGQTRPRLSVAYVLYSQTSYDIIPTTNGSGNIKGVFCYMQAGGPFPAINFSVNGGTMQQISFSEFPRDSEGDLSTGWIPYNIRFTTSIRVQMTTAASYIGQQYAQCWVSWALD
jgi:type 1 fimbria pilin